MKISEADILIAPGLGNSGPDHWQRRWADRMANARVIEQADWDEPLLTDWVDRIFREVTLATRPVVLIGHSLSVPAIVHTAQLRLKDTKVRGAFLVSPPDFEGPGLPETARPFGNVPTDPLPFPSLLVASTNDELLSAQRAADMAAAWGSELHFARDAGHINVASGHGPWPEGLLMFTRLMQRI